MSSAQDRCDASAWPRRYLALVGGALICVVVVVVVWRPWGGAGHALPDPNVRTTDEPIRVPPNDPRLTFATPFRNVRPGVKYVGDAACAECHEGHARTYRQHPMGRSLAPVATSVPEPDNPAAHNPFESAGLTYRVLRKGDRARHSESALDPGGHVVAETTAEVQYAVGSGRSGRAYLVDRGGYLFASPITWYPQKKFWALSPGYETQNPHFGRPITADCLFCHANRADHVAGTINQYRKPIFQGHAIGCERCHGPGELHVQRRSTGEKVAGLDDTIVNPARLEQSLREAICQQCHLQGQQRVIRRGLSTFDYRPGLPLHLFSSEFVKPPKYASTKFVGSVEQMVASRCYQNSTGPNRMNCTSCHDPHATPAPEKKIEFYRTRCLSCHADKGCSVPAAIRREQNKEDSCVACHMRPTGSNVPHTTITDHRILRRPDPAPKSPTDWPALDEIPLVHFHRHLLDGPDPEVDRDLGIALVQLADSQPSGAVTQSLAERALPLLERAVRRDPDDVPALEAKGSALWFTGRLEPAAAAYERVRQVAPDRETTLFLIANLALRMGRIEVARSAAERVVQINPWRWQTHFLLARVHAQANAWREAASSCQEALKLNAVELGTRRMLVLCHLRTGERALAELEFEKLMALKPPQEDQLRRWYMQETRIR